MLGAPSRGVHLPTDGLTGWADSARRVGEGMSAVLMGGAQMLQERARVVSAGELAEFSERLQSIDRETRDELADQDEVQDWDHSWQAASAPKIAEALNELSADSRQAGEKMAADFSARAALEARRDYELSRIDKARSRWRSQVERAVQQGDPARAQDILQAGQGIFVPEHGMQEECESTESRAQLNRWQQNLQADPLPALAQLNSCPQDQLPRRADDVRHLESAKRKAQRTARQGVLHTLLTCLQQGEAPEPAYMEQAAAAGIITPEQARHATAQSPHAPLPPAELNTWMQRIDDGDDDQEATEALQLQIATAPMPADTRRRLLQRVELSRTLPAADRTRLSRHLWSLYSEGSLGCPKDHEAQQHLAALLQDSLPRLAREGGEATANWVRNMRAAADRWVCFDPNSLT